MPSRAARWISWITLRSNSADSRSPGRQPRREARRSSSSRALPSVSNSVMPLIGAGVVDLEVVEAPRRAVAAELSGVAVVDARPVEQVAQLAQVPLAQLLLDAVRPQAGYLPAHVEVRLVDGVAEGVAGVAAHDEAALLGHEAAHVPNRAAHHDVHALHRDAAAGRGVAAYHEQAPAPGGAGRLARVAVDHNGPGHHVLRRPGAAIAVHAHDRLLVHARAVVAHVPFDVDLEGSVDSRGQGVRAARVQHAPAPRPVAVHRVQPGVQLAKRRVRQVDRPDGHVGRGHETRARSQTYTLPGSGSHTVASSALGSTAIARYSDAIATQSSVSAITAGLHAIGSRSTAKPSAVPTAKV